MISYATDLGIAKIAAAVILSAVGLTGFVGRIGFRLLADGIGGYTVPLLVSVLSGRVKFALAAAIALGQRRRRAFGASPLG